MTAAPPRFRFVPLHASTAAQDAIDLGEAAGLTLDEWQQQDLRDAMARTVHDRWAATEVGLVVPRQNGKGGILEVRQLWGLFLSKDSVLQTHTAHRFDTCLDHFRRVVSLIEGTPELLALVKDNGRGVGDRPSGIKDSNGKESIELAKSKRFPQGKRLNFKARSKGSGRGFSGDDVYFDEAFWLDDLGSLIPSLSARRDPQIWYTSSAPLPRVESDRLRAVVRRGRALVAAPDPSSRLCYLEHSADPKYADDLDNPEALEQANPAMSVGRITAEFAAVEREAMSDEEYARERLGIFPDEDDEPQWLVVTEAQYLACDPEIDVDVTGWLGEPVALAVELTADRETVTVVAAGQTEAGPGAQVVMREPNGAAALDAVALLASDPERPVVAVVVDPRSHAGSLVPDLEARGVTVVECSTKELVKGTGSLLDAIRTEGVALRRSPEMDAAVASAETRKYGDAELIDRWAGGDPTPFIAVVLARWGMGQVPDDTPSVYEERGLVTL